MLTVPGPPRGVLRSTGRRVEARGRPWSVEVDGLGQTVRRALRLLEGRDWVDRTARPAQEAHWRDVHHELPSVQAMAGASEIVEGHVVDDPQTHGDERYDVDGVREPDILVVVGSREGVVRAVVADHPHSPL